MNQHPPRQIFEKLVNKNAIKRKIGGPPLAIFPETLDPPLGILANTSSTPLDFQPVCIYDPKAEEQLLECF